MSLKPLESQRTKRTIDAGSTGELFQQWMSADEAVAAEGEAVVGVVGAEADSAGAPMACSSME